MSTLPLSQIVRGRSWDGKKREIYQHTSADGDQHQEIASLNEIEMSTVNFLSRSRLLFREARGHCFVLQSLTIWTKGEEKILVPPPSAKMYYKEKKETLLIALNVKSCIWLTVSKRGFCETLSVMEMCGCNAGSLSVLEETLLNQALGFKVCRALQQHTELHSPCSVHCTAPSHINIIYLHYISYSFTHQ